ncbi:MAG: GyrI-like domain-containing protein [Candidatus Micrarchaeota archaeon]
MEVQEVEMKPQLVLGMIKKGSYKEIPKMIEKLCKHAVKKGTQMAGAPIFVCHEMSKDEVVELNKQGCANVEVVVPVASKIKGTKDIECYEMSGGKMAKVINKGPYDKCDSAYNALFEWIGKNGKAIRGHCREVYLNDPKTVEKEEILTEIYAPIN